MAELLQGPCPLPSALRIEVHVQARAFSCTIEP